MFREVFANTITEIDKTFKEIIKKKMQKVERELYFYLIKDSDFYKNQLPKSKLLYSIFTVIIIPLLTILNCQINHKTCFNTLLLLRNLRRCSRNEKKLTFYYFNTFHSFTGSFCRGQFS